MIVRHMSEATISPGSQSFVRRALRHFNRADLGF